MIRRIQLLLILVSISILSYADDNLYRFNNMFSISVSDDLELRSDDDAYTRTLSDSLNILTGTEIVFQQKGLSRFDKNALAQYCRIMIVTDQDDSCPYPLSDDKDFTSSDLNDFNEMAEDQLGPGQYFMIDPVTTVETTTSGAVYIRTHYARSGTEGMVFVDICYFCNYDSLVRAIFSYRNSESSLWREHLLNAMKSFSWINPHVSKKSSASSNSYSSVDSNTDSNNSQLFLGIIIGAIIMAICYMVFKSMNSGNKKNNREQYYANREQLYDKPVNASKPVSHIDDVHQQDNRSSVNNMNGDYEEDITLQTNDNFTKHDEDMMKAGCVGIGFSVLFPIIGIILYFAQKKSVSNPSAYLYGALIGFTIGVLIRLMTL